MVLQNNYTISKLIEYTNTRIEGYLRNLNNSNSEDIYQIKQDTDNHLKEAHCGDESDKNYVKRLMMNILSERNGAHSETFPSDYCVCPENVNSFIPWNRPETINPYILFLAIFYHYKDTYGADTLGYLIDKYHFNNLRDRGGINGQGFYIDENDIRYMWGQENISMNFEDKFDVIVQLVYEETYGNSCIDEILYQNVGDISAGVSGVPAGISVSTAEGDLPAYQGCWVRYKGCSIHFMFLSFGSHERLKRAVKDIVSFNMRGQFSEKEGFKLGYGKDGSRRTAIIDPVGECPALWVRKFTEQTSTNEDLYGNIEGWQRVAEVECALIKGGATIPVCGAQGSGKTTKLKTLVEYIQNFYSIRVIESEFEARLRSKYPLKNIFTIEANDTSDVTPDMAYNFTLRSAGDIYIIGEARSDDMIINVTRTANRGGRSVLFTFHPKTAAMTIPEIANAMIRQKIYTNLKDAIATALNTVKVCIFVTVDIETHQHFYEIYEFVPLPNLIPDAFLHAYSKDERDIEFMRAMHSYMQTMASADTYYATVPIVEYDRDERKYVMRNTISESLFNELIEKTPLEGERMDLKKVFRPDRFIRSLAKQEQVEITQEYINKTIEDYNLEKQFVTLTAPTVQSIK